MFKPLVWLDPEKKKNPGASGIRTRGLPPSRRTPLTTRPTRRFLGSRKEDLKARIILGLKRDDLPQLRLEAKTRADAVSRTCLALVRPVWGLEARVRRGRGWVGEGRRELIFYLICAVWHHRQAHRSCKTAVLSVICGAGETRNPISAGFAG